MSMSNGVDAARGRHGTRARFIVCAHVGCGRGFLLCSHCDRGNRYCSKECAAAARKIYLVTIRRKYASSPEAREDHRARMERQRDECRRARPVMDLCRQKPATDRNLPPRPLPAVNSTSLDAGSKAGHRSAPLFRRSEPRPRPDARFARTPHGVRCAECRRVITLVQFDPPDRR
jgi:hypothetical protein